MHRCTHIAYRPIDEGNVVHVIPATIELMPVRAIKARWMRDGEMNEHQIVSRIA